MVSMKIKMISSLLASIIHHIGIDFILPISAFNVYFLSYIHHFGDKAISLFDIYYSGPLFLITSTSFGFLGGRLDNKLGCHITILIGTIFLVIGIGLLFFAKGFAVWMLVYLFLGVGIGISRPITTKNICLYVPKKRGLISSVVVSLGGLTAALCSFFGETLINPNNEKAEHIKDNQNEFFSKEVSKGIIKYFLIVVYVVLPLITLTMLLMFQFKNIRNLIPITVANSFDANPLLINDNTDTKQDINSNKDNYLIDKPIEKDENEEENNNEQENILDKTQIVTNEFEESMVVGANKKKPQSGNKVHLKKILHNKRIWILSSLNFLSLFSLHCVIGTYRVIATTNRFNINIPKYGNLISGILLIIVGPLWGFLGDKFTYKSLYITINSLIIVSCCSIYFFLQYHYIYTIIFVVCRLLLVGFGIIKTPYLMKIYSMKYYMEVGAIIALVGGISNILCSLFNNQISNLTKKIGNDKPYLYAFGGASALNVIGIVIGFFTLNNEPLVYNDTINQKDINNISELISNTSDMKDEKKQKM